MSQITISMTISRGLDVLFRDTYTIHTSDTVLSLKQTIEAAHGFSVASQNLHTVAVKMEDDKTLADYDVKSGDRLRDLLVGA